MKGDKVIWIVTLLLGIISLIVVYSATSALAVSKYSGSTGTVLMKHLGMLVFGFLMMFGASKINYKHYAKIAWLLMIPCLALLLYTLVFGRNINDASRSINVGGFSFQPSEMAKIILITYLARQLVMMGDTKYNIKDFLIKLALPILATAGLIFSENLSTAMILVFVCMVLLFIGRVKMLHMAALVGLCVVGMGFYLIFDVVKTNIDNKHRRQKAEETMVISAKTGEFKEKQNRIQTWSNRLKSMGEDKGEIDRFDDKHMQRTYADIAVASGSVFGKGPGKSEQRNFLPHPYSDFIYAIIIEELGFFGATFVIFLYIVLLFRTARIASQCENNFPAFLAMGLALLLVVQATFNMLVAVGIAPVTGQPLPLISKGGTSTIINCAYLGIILSVSRSAKKSKSKDDAESE